MYDGDSNDEDDGEIVAKVLFLLLVQMPCSMFGIQHNVMFKPYSILIVCVHSNVTRQRHGGVDYRISIGSLLYHAVMAPVAQPPPPPP